MSQLEAEIRKTKRYFSSARFRGITRLYSPRQVVEQRGTIRRDYSIAKNAAGAFYKRLRELFAERKQITSFGPYSPGQAVMMKRKGIEGIYLGGWATSAKGSIGEDQGADLASYPLSQVPDEAAPIVRALLAADKNQRYNRARMTEKERQQTPEIDYSPFIIADADTGHGGDAHVRNLIRRFVEAGVTGYHIEDHTPGPTKCRPQGGKVLVPSDEQIKRLNAARFQLDIMEVPGIIVSRTDAEAATLLDGNGDERDQPFVLGATKLNIPSYKNAYLTILKRIHEKGVKEINGHKLYKISKEVYAETDKWLEETGIASFIDENIEAMKGDTQELETALDSVVTKFVEIWEEESGLSTFGETIETLMEFNMEQGIEFDMTIEQWREFAKTASTKDAMEKADSLGIDYIWDPEISRTPEGYSQVKGGIEYAIAKSLAVAPFADLLWMETKTADLEDARQFADAIHEVFPDKMLAYNLSPSFNWDTTGMTDEEMKKFPEEIGKLGFVFDFITYGGHQIDGMAAEEFATALMQDGMLALARVQRRLRLIDSPYKTPQTHVGGPRMDGALVASSGRTATTKAMGKGSTQFQHLVQTEVSIKLLEEWLEAWTRHYKIKDSFTVELKPHTVGTFVLELDIMNGKGEKVADVIFEILQDRKGEKILTVRDENNFDPALRQKRLATLLHLFLIHRYRTDFVHYVSPTEDNLMQTKGMMRLGIYESVNTEVGHIIVTKVNVEYVKELLSPDRRELKKLIAKKTGRRKKK
ncbi:MAG: isocitrate lyase [Candidatus Dadabacteria bacterium]|nr:isocitrate lyase [Candidatus Dadabacteria bacterium]